MKELHKCDCQKFNCADLKNGDRQRISKETGNLDFVKGDTDKCELRHSFDNDFGYFLRPLDNQDDWLVDIILRK